MKTALVFSALCSLAAVAITPAELAREMSVGINLGNVLDAPHEGDWAPPAQERYFDDYLKVGLRHVRIPVRWDLHTGTAAPYTIDADWLARVETIVGWAEKRGLIAIINSHHDDWLDNETDFDAQLPRFGAIWTQVGTRFQSHPDNNLVFEVYNEPHAMSIAQLNTMNSAALAAIRVNNPTRTVILGGLFWEHPGWLVDNPEALTIPNDPNIMVEVHGYDPYEFCDNEVKTFDAAALTLLWDNTAAWAAAHGVVLYHGEFGVEAVQDHDPRIAWYKAVHDDCLAKYGMPLGFWDDGGDFPIYNRTSAVWDTDVLHALGL